MNPKRTLDRLEHDLSHFLISEMCKSDPSKRGTPEMYKYMGLNISVNLKSKEEFKTIAVRIGALEAKFKVDDCEKNSGFLAPDEERLIKIWMGQSDTNYQMKALFRKEENRKEIAIIPFDLENFYS